MKEPVIYVPAHFDEPSREVLYELIENSALGMLITHGRSGRRQSHPLRTRHVTGRRRYPLLLRD
ncbi:FMN-binding negative transcriptional regulator [Mesorhizobium sp. M0976]|uniref:FMN-binding negative transcriptional regulator n=1 Tax=Mesorhizobium sp. M0976 TaxID=2957038 RepID=UPI00333A0B20